MDQHLAHHGIKGMKWGVRRAEVKTGRRPSVLDRFSSQNKPAVKKPVPAKPAEKKISDMTDDELRAKINRFNMEKQYRQYLAEMNPKRASKFKKVAGEIIESGIKTLAAKGFERIASNILAKADEEDLPTKTSIKDIAKLGDKKMAAIIKRLESEKKLGKLLNGEDVAKKEKKGKDKLAKLMADAKDDDWSELWLI